MTDNPFAAPGSPGSGIDWSAHKGHLLFIEPLAVETGIKTSFGDADAVRADVAAIQGDGLDEAAEYPDTLIFPKVLQSQLRTKVGEKVLGRLSQGEAKPGQSPPWILQEATQTDIEIGKKWIAHLEEKAAERAAKPPVNTSSATHVAKQEAEQQTVSTPF